MADKIFLAGLVGVSGYTGMELARLLAGHPNFRLMQATSRAEAGRRLGDLYPSLRSFAMADLVISEPTAKDLAAHCDVVFLAVPHGVAMESAANLRAKGLKVIDLSADFRLNDEGVYNLWYGGKHTQAGLLAEAVYGLPELYAGKIAGASLVANPGCYPTASILGLYPALKEGIIHSDGIIIDAKSGASGAGRGASVPNLFCEVEDSFRAYNIGGKHRHTPEIEQELGKISGRDITVSFNPHLLPVNRGILATIYTTLAKDLSLEGIHAVYSSYYANDVFVRVLPMGSLPSLRDVRGSMFCDIALVKDPRSGRLIIVSAIDNLCRGASGQALANANLMCGLPLGAGLHFAPMAP